MESSTALPLDIAGLVMNTCPTVHLCNAHSPTGIAGETTASHKTNLLLNEMVYVLHEKLQSIAGELDCRWWGDIRDRRR